MRERTHEIKIRLNDEELAHLNEMVSRSIYNRETFLRLLIDGCTMQECPKEYNEFRVTLIRLASNLKLFKFNSALTPEEERRLMQIGDEVWALVKEQNCIKQYEYYQDKPLTSKQKKILNNKGEADERVKSKRIQTF